MGGDLVTLESKRRTNPIGPSATVTRTPSSPVTSLPIIPLVSSSIAIDKDTPPPVLHVSPSVPVVGEAPF
ncbi:hypothetical protein J1N35_005871 [Gossypium stocksii]|uniref:Uncharacterized protein n=1 Tax=Gossypium stocksii TaxID=47602 RepID=A0A9D3WET1_9ROSI|nr:hypothetical protein J1N35_005871 [Gossypium stocksii]